MNRSAQQFLEALAGSSKTPGIQYAFFDREEILFHFGSGFADLRTHEEFSASHTINAYSVTKTFTALGILMLAMEGKLNLEDSYRKYLPSLPYPDNITILQLLTHSAGIPNPLPLNWIHLPSEHAAFDWKIFFYDVFWKHAKPGFSPNAKFSYSNLGYVMLGRIIEEITGSQYAAFIEEKILRPLSIDKGALGFVHPETARHAKGYQKNFSFMNWMLGFFIDKAKFTEDPVDGWLPFKDFYVNGISYGGLIASLHGLVNYVQSFLRPANPFLSAAFLSILLRENKTRAGRSTGMTCSWFTGTLNHHRYFCHAGGGGGFYCEIRFYPDIQKGSVVIFNRSGMSDERFLNRTDSFFF